MQGNAQIQTAKQSQRVNTQQIQFLNFLFLNQQELDRYINQEMLENPFLEVEKESTISDDLGDNREVDESLAGEMRMDEVYSSDDLQNDQPDYKLSNPSSSDGTDWKDLQMERFTETEDVRDLMLDQLKYMKLSESELEIAHFLVHSTNERGFLEGDLSSLTDNLGFATGQFYDESEIDSVKKVVNNLEPQGYACFNIEDYIRTLISISSEIDNEIKEAALKIFENGLDEFSQLKAGQLADSHGIEEEVLDEVLDFIATIKPYPTKGFGDSWQAENTNIIPDYQISLVNDKLKGEILSSSSYNFNVNEDYASSMKNTARNGTNSYISSKLKSAYWLIDAIQQREETMTKVIEAIVYLQGSYLVSGENSDLRPMILKDVAEYIDMTISTVSRVTSNKYARTPIGLINLKDLFTEAIELDNGERKSNKEVQDMVVKLVEEEDKNKPLSDFDLRNALKLEGISLTRRTITKYRMAANIPSSKERKLA